MEVKRDIKKFESEERREHEKEGEIKRNKAKMQN